MVLELSLACGVSATFIWIRWPERGGHRPYPFSNSPTIFARSAARLADVCNCRNHPVRPHDQPPAAMQRKQLVEPMILYGRVGCDRRGLSDARPPYDDDPHPQPLRQTIHLRWRHLGLEPRSARNSTRSDCPAAAIRRRRPRLADLASDARETFWRRHHRTPAGILSPASGYSASPGCIALRTGRG